MKFTFDKILYKAQVVVGGAVLVVGVILWVKIFQACL